MSLLLALLLAVAPAKPGEGAKPPPRAIPHPTIYVRLHNGLRVVLVQMEGSGLAAYYTLVRVGSRNEVEPGHSGFAHLFEHMMFKGTPKWPTDRRSDELVKLGFDVNAYTTDDVTIYASYGPAAGLGRLVELEADRFQNLAYTEAELQTEARTVLGEYNKSASNPELRLEEVLVSTAFKRHTYGHTTLGWLADIQAMPRRYAYSLKFFDRHYRPDNCVIVVAGDFDPSATMDDIRKHYGTWKGKAAQPPVPDEPEQSAERRQRVTWPVATQPRIVVGYRAPPARFTDRQAAVAAVLSALLLGPAGELHADLVLGRQLVERLEPWTVPHRDPHLFAFQVVLKREADRAEVLRTIDAAIERVAGGKLDAALLADVKSNLRYGGMMELETAAQVADAVARGIGVTGEVEAINAYYAALAQVTAEDVSRFANTYLRPRGRTVVDLVAP